MRVISTFLILFVSLFVSLPIFASRLLSLSEADIPEMVKQGNDLVKAEEQKVKSLTHKTGSLRRSFVPKTIIVLGTESFKYVTDSYNSQPYYGAELEMNVYNGGRDRLRENIAMVNVNKGKSFQKIETFKQIEEARKSFWRAVYLNELISQYESALKIVNDNKIMAVRRIKAGVATRSDKYEFQIKEVELNQDIHRSHLLFEREKAQLKNLLGIDLERPIQLKEKLTHDHGWEKLKVHSEEVHNYLLEPLVLESEKNKLQSKIGYRKWLPQLDAYVLWLQNNQRRDFERFDEKDRQQTAFGVRATWNLLDGIEGRAQGAASESMAKSSQYNLEFRRREVETEIHMELRELKLLDDMVHSADENIKRARDFFKLISDEYRRGVKTSGDMLLATEKLVDSEIRKINILRDLQIAKAHVMVKLGQ